MKLEYKANVFIPEFRKIILTFSGNRCIVDDDGALVFSVERAKQVQQRRFPAA